MVKNTQFPWRMIQTNLAEIHMLDIQAEQYVKDLLAFDATVVLLNTAGIIASYETKLKYHFQSPYLQGDSLKTLVAVCQSAGIKVIARTDFSKIRYPIYELHPEWAYRRQDGEIVCYEGNVHLCPNGYYQQEYMLKIIEEVFTEIPFDGIFFNFAGFYGNDYDNHDHGMCYCENCRQRFQAEFQMDLPTIQTLNNPAYRNYKVFIGQCTKAQEEKIRTFIKQINPKILVPGVDYVRLESNTEIGRALPHWQYSASSNTRGIRGTGESGIIPSNTSVDFIGFKSRFVTVGEELTELRLWQNLANLGGLDYYLMGRLDNKDDRTPYQAVKKVFSFHKKHEEIFTGLQSVADVCVIRERHWSASHEERGWVRVLTETQMLFDELIQEDALTQSLTKYKVIILPNQPFLLAGLAEKLDKFVRLGGILVTTGMSGFVNHKYEQLEQPLLKSIGVIKLNYIKEDTGTALLQFKVGEKEIFTDFEDCDVIGLHGQFLMTALEQAGKKYLSYIHESPAGPPELVYHSKVSEDIFGVSCYSYGQGAGVFIPWNAGAYFYQEGYPNTFRFMQGVLKGLCQVTSVAKDLTGMVEVTLAKNEQHYLISFVNNSGHFGTSYVKPLPIYKATIEIPYPKEPYQVRTLVEEDNCEYSYENGQLLVRIKELENYEAVVVR